ncbi:hypothetical protein FQR65_LT01706 [Abscondita terminalis]|nr:hypothetical protein FQR65_LT01706 [Abscondita terminalis]
MFCLMSDCAENFINFFDKSQTMTVELKDAFTRYTNDVIASVAFGVNCNSLQQRDNEFYTMGREATNFSGFWKNLSFVLMIVAPTLAKFLGVTVFNKKVSAFFRRLVSENIKSREKNGIVRPDMINLLMEAKNERLLKIQETDVDADRSMLKREFSDDDLTAQALIFFFAGFESVSTLMCFTAYELAVDPMVQRKLQDEIDTVWQCESTLTYEALQKMEYLDMVISETLRKWPSAIATDRLCVKPYTIQPEKEGEKPINLVKGDVIWLPIVALHYDEQYFPEPDRFIPERFSQENKASLNSYAYIPFGVGPRNCIGNRFALLETKILFCNLLKKFDIVIVDKSVVPMKLSRKQFNPTSENGFWFGLKPRHQTTL